MSATQHNAILIGPDDSVVTVIRAMTAGEPIYYQKDGEMQTITAATDIPIYHKAAITDVPKGEKVIKYSEVIGIATKDIAIGEHVHVQNIKSEA